MNQRPTGSSATLLLELGDRVRRSWWTLVAGVCFGLAGGVVALQHIPQVYEATTRVWVNEQEISSRVVESTVKDEMTSQLAAFRAAVIADEYLIELIRRTFGPPTDDAELTARMSQVRGGLRVHTVQSRRDGLRAFELAYRDEDPRRAADIVNTLAELQIMQNDELRKQSAVNVADAIHAMADKAREEFEEIDARLVRFKRAHQFETEEHLSTNVRLLDSRRRELEALTARRDLLRRDLRLAEEELVTAKSRAEALDDPGVVGLDPTVRKIAETKRELENLRVRYTDTHPDVTAKRRELEELLAEARSRPGGETDAPAAAGLMTNPQIASIEQRIRDLGDELVKMDTDEKTLHADIAEYERRIQVEPEVQRQLTELEEEHAVLREKWRRLEREAEGAEGSIVLEETDMAESMEIIAKASVPASPIEPDPRRIYLTFVMAGVALFLGPMLAHHALNPPITSQAGLAALTDVPVLVSIPRIATPLNRGQGRKNLLKNIAFSIVAGAVLLSVKFYL